MRTQSSKDSTRTDANQSSEQIARRVDETRTEIDHTLDALQARLSPRQILSRTAASARARGRASLEKATQFAKNEPATALLLTIGIASPMIGLALLRGHSARHADRRGGRDSSLSRRREERKGLTPELAAKPPLIATCAVALALGLAGLVIPRRRSE